MNESYSKLLTANDVGETGSHQAGVCIPRTNNDLIAFFPSLDVNQVNPATLIDCIDPKGKCWRFRYIYYNGKIHKTSSRNEYRLTCLTPFYKAFDACSGDLLTFTKYSINGPYHIRIEKQKSTVSRFSICEPEVAYTTSKQPVVIKLRGWRKIH